MSHRPCPRDSSAILRSVALLIPFAALLAFAACADGPNDDFDARPMELPAGAAQSTPPRPPPPAAIERPEREAPEATTPRLSAEEIARLRSVGREPLSSSPAGAGTETEENRGSAHRTTSDDGGPDDGAASAPRELAPCPCGQPVGDHGHRHHRRHAFDPREELLGRWRVLEVSTAPDLDAAPPEGEAFANFDGDHYRLELEDGVQAFDYTVDGLAGRRVSLRVEGVEGVVTLLFVARDRVRATREDGSLLMNLQR